MNWLGLDIGGANLKAADGQGWAQSVPFALWRDPAGLPGALRGLVNVAPAADSLAVTMTGELCDCFRTKVEGVRHILAAVEQAAGGREIRVYLVDGRFVSVNEAKALPQLAAASNWHALASFAGRYTGGGAGLVLDIGSTTADIVPLAGGRPDTLALTDTDRLVAGELVYTGVGRTPLCAVTHEIPWRGAQCPAAAELFATTADAYVLLGELPERSTSDWTADGRPLTREFARERLARMVCADASSFMDEDAQRAAEHVRNAQLEQLRGAVTRVLARRGHSPSTVVLSGSGEFLARRIIGDWPAGAVVSLAQELGPEASSAAAAHAIAVIARERNASTS